jgi:hypothetical protein
MAIGMLIAGHLLQKQQIEFQCGEKLLDLGISTPLSKEVFLYELEH